MLIINSNYFVIKEIEVKNNELISRDEVITLSNVINENIFLLNKENIKTNIMNNPYVENVKIKRKLPSKLVIDIKEKDIKGIIRVNNYFVDVDSQGRMIHTVNQFPNGKLIFIEGVNVKEYVYNNTIASDNIQLNAVVSVLKLFDFTQFKTNIQKVNVKDPYNIKIILKNGIEINIGDASNLEYKISYANTLINNESIKDKQGTIEISSDGTAVFKEKQEVIK